MRDIFPETTLPPLGTLSFAQSRIDRGCERRMAPGLLDAIWSQDTTRFLVLSEGKTLIGDGQISLLPDLGAVRPDIPVYLGRTTPSAAAHTDAAHIDAAHTDAAHTGAVHTDPGHTGIAGAVPADTDIVLADLTSEQLAALPGPRAGDSHWLGLRDAAMELSPRDAGLFVEAVAVANWHRTHRHCPRCGAATEVEQGGWVRRCPIDSSEHYPRTDPAIIVAITDAQDRLLLGSSAQWAATRYSTLAGFVEPGESLEDAVIREIGEEAGLLVCSPRYMGSQPWPFPGSLMLGFTAHADDTDARADGVEIREVRWFTRDELAGAVGSGRIQIAGGISIARRLIEHWYGGPIKEPELVG